MQIIIISPNNKIHRHFHLSRSRLVISITLVLPLLFAITIFTKQWFSASPSESVKHHVTSQPELIQSNQIEISSNTPDTGDFYAKRLGQLQAEAIRLKAITEQLANMSDLDMSDFMLPEPARGGLESYGKSLSESELDNEIDQLTLGFQAQQKQLNSLQNYLLTQDNITSAIPRGRPIQGGWVSSYYGKRIDPFTGKEAFHHGIDLAGKSGSDVFAVADGIVTWIGQRGGYGGLIEVDHGNGYITRYAHNKTIKVEVGDRVNKGQVLALMGSTGRSTGPHVHFEVLRDGKNVNPYSFIK